MKNKTGCKKVIKWCGIVLIIIALGIILQTYLLNDAWTDGPIGSRLKADEKRVLISLHNKARGDAGVGPIVWSKNLAAYAQSWADHLASTNCRMEHRPHSGQWKQTHGENLFMGVKGYHGAVDAVQA